MVTADDLAVRLLPTDPRDMVPSTVAWAQAVEEDVDTVLDTEIRRAYRVSLTAVIWVLAAAADYQNRIPPDHTAKMLAREAGVGDRVWQKRSAWLRARGWLEHGPGGRPTMAGSYGGPSDASLPGDTACPLTRDGASAHSSVDSRGGRRAGVLSQRRRPRGLAVRWSRTFRAVEQRRRRPQQTTRRTGNGWFQPDA